MRRPRVLFFAESVTTSQVVRLVSLARALPGDEYDVHFASAAFDPLVFGGAAFVRHSVHSLPPETVAARVRSGRRIYGKAELSRYVAEDRTILDRVKPDLLIGDFRLSLPVSAALARVPFASLINAYWSPHAVRASFPMPEHPVVRLLGVRLAEEHFPKALPFVFSHFARPVNDLRRAHGLPPLGTLPDVLTAGDHCLYADTPGLVPTEGAPANHVYLGPVHWSPDLPLPSEVQRWTDTEEPVVYVTLGSSGSAAALPVVLAALGELPVRALVSTAGRPPPARVPSNVVVAPYVPGHLAARLASVVVSNGGSSTSYQALAEGRPVLGIAENLDQYLAMTAIQKQGSGILLRSGTLTPDGVRRGVESLLGDRRHRDRARAVAAEFRAFPYAERFRAFVRGALAGAARGVRGAAVGTIAAVALFLCLPPRVARAEAPSTNEIRFGMSVASADGHVLCALFRRAGWLEKPVQWKKVAVRKGQVECVFSGVEPGVYALSAIHDENDNGKLDTNFLGIPTESWCTSRDAPAFFGPPSFDAAKFQYRGSVMRLRSSLR